MKEEHEQNYDSYLNCPLGIPNSISSIEIGVVVKGCSVKKTFYFTLGPKTDFFSASEIVLAPKHFPGAVE